MESTVGSNNFLFVNLYYYYKDLPTRPRYYYYKNLLNTASAIAIVEDITSIFCYQRCYSNDKS